MNGEVFRSVVVRIVHKQIFLDKILLQVHIIDLLFEIFVESKVQSCLCDRGAEILVDLHVKELVGELDGILFYAFFVYLGT